MIKDDLNNITVTKDNVANLAEIALDLKLPNDDLLRKKIRTWYFEHSPAKERVCKKLKEIQEMLDNGYSITAISKACHTDNRTIKTLINQNKIKIRYA